MSNLTTLFSISAMFGGLCIPKRKQKAVKAAKKYRKESEKERRLRQSLKG